MAWNDYYVIAYKILAYLYGCLKDGKDIDEKYLRSDSPFFKYPINERYWRYIIGNLYKQGYIDGLSVDDTFDNCPVVIGNIDRTEITPAGIEYLCDNSFIAKVKQFLKDTKDMTPFI